MYYRVKFPLEHGKVHYPGIDFPTEMEAVDYAEKSTDDGGYKKAVVYQDGVDILNITALS